MKKHFYRTVCLSVAVVIIGSLIFAFASGNYSIATPASTSQVTNNVTGSEAPSTQNGTSVSNLALQAECATYAHSYFVQNGYKLTDGFTYQNHYSEKLDKCFILISSAPDYNSNPDGNITIDVYDAVEGKHYAEFDGWLMCNSSDGNCQLASGGIWYDGNDRRNPPDVREGFGGLQYGGVGDQNTEAKFLNDVQYFMAS